jgi:hypothetical protein
MQVEIPFATSGAIFADLERKQQDRAAGVVVIDNGDLVSLLVRRTDGSLSWVTLDIPKAQGPRFVEAVRSVIGGPTPNYSTQGADECSR